MVIAGAGGHAVEVLHIFDQLNALANLHFFDNTNSEEKLLFDRFRIIFAEHELEKTFKNDNRFVLGIGTPHEREKLALLLQEWGGALTSAISPTSNIGRFDVSLEAGLNIMSNVVISNRVKVGEGTLLNTACSIHHDVTVGKYCEVCPGARLLGHCKLGDFSFIGSGAIVLPGISIGNNCVVGAGAVVTKSVPDRRKVCGVPAREALRIDP